ncbi:hypothetical protein EVAR_80294_1 [Eumeta japonica]|uniref:Uncharacterized protein n=1 Tax=Eumeta variegata TaxID=151549 RepID=A0A4C1UC21_EUMVA|nr:hypothetical protein EVAR_80294_1 [Eumeta japonica]
MHLEYYEQDSEYFKDLYKYNQIWWTRSYSLLAVSITLTQNTPEREEMFIDEGAICDGNGLTDIGPLNRNPTHEAIHVREAFKIIFDFDEDLQFLLAMKLLKSKKKRRYWVHPINRGRQDKGEFHRLVRELESDDEKFHQYFRMNQAQYEEIHSLIEGDIKKVHTKFREPIGFECDPDGNDDDWIYVGD